jgi:carboxylate-amine ligase
MRLNFRGSSFASIGVEIEVQIINPRTSDLIPKAVEILEFCEKNQISGVKAEIHQSMLEIETAISKNISECRKCLEERLAALKHIQSVKNLQIAIAGTHPFQNWNERIFMQSERYALIHSKYQWLAKRLNVYGMHTHIGIPTLSDAISIMNKLAWFLPHLLAISANSPFWHGVDTGMESCRLNILEAFPYAGIPPYFHDEKSFLNYLNILSESGAISSIKDLYWFIRPNFDFGTIEFRVCDAVMKIDDMIGIVALIQSLVQFCLENPSHSIFQTAEKNHLVIPMNLFNASRDGLSTKLISIGNSTSTIRDELMSLLPILKSTAIKLECDAELQHCKNMILHNNGAAMQRYLFNSCGDLNHVVAACCI